MEFSHGNQPSIWGTIYGNTHLGHFSPKIWDIMAAMPGIYLSLHVGWVRCKQLKPKLRAGRSANWMIYFSRFQSFRWPRFPQFRCVWLLALRETLQCRAGNDQVETAAIRRCRDLGRPINAGYGHPILRRNQHKVIYRWHSLIASNNTGYFPMKPLKFPMARIENRPPLREARRSGSPAIPRAVVSPPWLQWIMGSCRSLCSGKTWILWDAEDGGIDFPMCLCSKCWSYCKSFLSGPSDSNPQGPPHWGHSGGWFWFCMPQGNCMRPPKNKDSWDHVWYPMELACSCISDQSSGGKCPDSALESQKLRQLISNSSKLRTCMNQSDGPPTRGICMWQYHLGLIQCILSRGPKQVSPGHGDLWVYHCDVPGNNGPLIQVVPGQAAGGNFKFKTPIAYRAEQELCL